jgi:hypothetical protein
MRRRGRAVPLVLAALASVIAPLATCASLAAGCSSDATPATSPLGECLPTLDSANGSACADGLVCPYTSVCGSFEQRTTCSCLSRVLVCVVEGADAALPPGSEPSCSPLSNPPACPKNEPVSRAACSALGIACLYDAVTCPGTDGGALVDTCECQGADDGGLVYSCAIAQCPTAGDASPSGDSAPPLSDAGDSGAASDASDAGGGDSDLDDGGDGG